MSYSESDLSAAVSDLCNDLMAEGNISPTDIDGMAMVTDDAEKMIVDQLMREGVSMADAATLVSQSSTKTAKATPISRQLVDAAMQNRFLPVEASNDAGEAPADTTQEEPAEPDAPVNDANEQTAPVAADMVKTGDASEGPDAPQAVLTPTRSAPTGNAERAQRLHAKIGFSIEMKKVSEVFTAIEKDNKLFDFEIPVAIWDRPHPGIPVIDKAYNMEEESLATVLYAIARKKSTAIVGPHGAGKTKLIEQIGARLGFPVTVIPMDGQITRSELFGQEKIRSTPTGPESYFQYGILPMALEEPGFIMFDEIDRADPSIQYACHSVYEQTYLALMEHDGRRINLHKYNRVFATANTKGRGSEDGMYSGDNEMSEATRDRFSLWIEMDYQDPEDDIIVLKAKIKGIDDRTAKVIAKLAHSIRNGFKQSSLSQTCSMRQQLETADMAVHLIKIMKASKVEEKMDCLRRAIDKVILGRANEQDQNSIEGYMTSIEPKLTPTSSAPAAAAGTP